MVPLVPFVPDDGVGEGSTVVSVGELPVVVVGEESVPLPVGVIIGADGPVVVVGAESVPLPVGVEGGIVGAVESPVVVGEEGAEAATSAGVAPGVVSRATKALHPLMALVSRLTVEVPLPPQDE
jgi:hypothetical protein